ncbi:DUF3017 domain-containing protein [Actinocrinis puniceicyclus]|uniref:DUF3017 domain-containing protein n=1 Tax=Actinocrinis puniceicyclus TaxID=977794 RepID=A0A8J8BCF8_9ACTN|nr:DUF3017 domain-containing protein [Actinocrinis puniceicyclus]MBS2961734.1 DUF3017 domain-containing protein [Actinocrinis puniceicyclus]
MEVVSHRGGAPIGRALRAVAVEWPFSVVFATATIAVIIVSFGALKHGLVLLASALLLGSVLRFVLSPARAGLLAVRRRGVDVVTMALLGALLLLLALFADTV